MKKRTDIDRNAADNRALDEAILGAAAAKSQELKRDFTLPDGDLMHLVDRGEIAVLVLSPESLRRFKAVDRTRDRRKLRGVLGADVDAAIALHRAVTERAATLGKRVLIRGEYVEPKRVTQKRQRPSTEQVQQRFLELADVVGFAPEELAQPRPGKRTDLSEYAAELKQAQWYVATQLRASFDPPPTYDQLGAVMGVTGPRVHQITKEFQSKEEVDGK